MDQRSDSSPATDALVARFRAALPDKLRELALAWERWLAAPESAPDRTRGCSCASPTAR